MDNKEIRFIDSHYNELFRIKDGESITVTFKDGSNSDRECKYIDDYHAKIGYNVYHICEFAELIEKSGGKYRPKDVPTYNLEKIEQSEFEYMFSPKDDTKNRGCVCYVRGCFDNSIDERFQSVALIENKENYKKYHTDDFRLECDNIINYFRFQSETPILKSRRDMQSAAYDLKPERFSEDTEICGYRLTTDKNIYYLKCDARQGQYNLYMYAYDKETLTKYRDLEFVEKNYAEIDKDKFYINSDSVTEMYYNPDANAGGQFVEITICKDDIKDAARMYKKPDEFFSYLEGVSKGSLYDAGTHTFRETAEGFMESKADFEGGTKKTMEALKKFAGVEPEKRQKKEEFER